MARRLRVYVSVKRAPRSVLGRRRYRTVEFPRSRATGERWGRFSNTGKGGIRQGTYDHVTGGFSLGWLTRPWLGR